MENKKTLFYCYIVSLLVFIFCFSLSKPVFATDYFVSPTGFSTGDGSISNPWDLQTALSGAAGKILPGDTINLRGGTYNQTGYFRSTLTGNANAYIKVQSYPGEWAVLNRNSVDVLPSGVEAFLDIRGNYTIYRGFEVMSSDPHRVCSYSPCEFKRATDIVLGAPGHNNKAINLVVHDGGLGFFMANGGDYAEAYGNIIYYNGVTAPNGERGHAIYIQNANSTKYATDNIMFNDTGYGIHGYAEGSYINYINVQGNTSFSNGEIGGSRKTNILIGGYQPDLAEWPILKDNYTYYSGSGGGTGVNLGYNSGCLHPRIGSGNYFAGGSTLITFVNCSDISMTGNTFYGNLGSLASTYPNNTYYSSRPTSNSIFVRPNRYEKGRANITVYNWTNSSSVEVDVSSVLNAGDSYEVKDAQNYLGPAIASGTYQGGNIAIPMTSTAVAQPIGDLAYPAKHTPIEFGAFVLKRPGAPVYLEPPDNYGSDTIPPSVPRAFDAVLEKADQFELRWGTSYDNASSTGASGYKIYRNGTFLTSVGNVSSYLDSNLTPNTAYSYTISAFDAAGNESAPTPAVSATTSSPGATVISFRTSVFPDSNYGANDNDISETTPDTNYCGGQTVKVSGSESSGSGKDRSSLFKFDISAVPAGSIVVGAQLSLYVTNGTTQAYQIYELRKPWTDCEVTWNKASNSLVWELPGAKGLSDRGTVSLADFGPASDFVFKNVSLNSAGVATVQNWVNNAAVNFGVIIANPDNTDGVNMATNRYIAGKAYYPRLTVAYLPAGFLPGDLNNSGHVDITDLRIALSSFGNPYNIFQVSEVINNFGK